MGFLKEFRDFAVKGNVIDLAVGVIIGASFGRIVDSIVNDLLMPLIGWITGGLDFSNYFIALSGQTASTLAQAKQQGAVFAYGSFITALVYFFILAILIFVMVRQINRLKRETAPPPPATAEDILLLREIRDALKK